MNVTVFPFFSVDGCSTFWPKYSVLLSIVLRITFLSTVICQFVFAIKFHHFHSLSFTHPLLIKLIPNPTTPVHQCSTQGLGVCPGLHPRYRHSGQWLPSRLPQAVAVGQLRQPGRGSSPLLCHQCHSHQHLIHLYSFQVSLNQ